MSAPVGIPERLGRYQVLSLLGRGSMGQVYLALDPNIQRKVALKVLLPMAELRGPEQGELRRRFILEAQAAGRLQHPGVVLVYDADTDPATGFSFIAMEWVDGPSLLEVLQEAGALDPSRAVRICERMAVALEAAHEQGLVHRDVKPANILLCRDGQPKLTDFGIARLASLSITGTGWIPGSPFYMSPEQVRNEGIDGRSDLYSLGVVLYQCLTGKVPFDSESLAGITDQILSAEPQPPRELNPQIPEEIAAVIERLLRKAPEDRFQTGGELAGELRSWVSAGRAPAVPAADIAPVSRVRSETGTVFLPETEQPAERTEPGASVPLPAWAKRQGAWWTSAAAVLLLAGVLFVSLRPTEAEPVMQSALPDSFWSYPADADAAVDQGIDSSAVEAPALPEEPPVERRPEPVAAPPPVAPDLPMAQTAASGVPAELPVRTAPPAVASTATLEIVFRNRLKDGTVSVSIDDDRVWEEDVASQVGFFKRSMGRNFWAQIPVPAGHHVLDVRVSGSAGKVDAVKRIETTFVDGETRRLRLALIPPKILRLSWKDEGDE